MRFRTLAIALSVTALIALLALNVYMAMALTSYINRPPQDMHPWLPDWYKECRDFPPGVGYPEHCP